jgi:hypothetical protein
MDQFSSAPDNRRATGFTNLQKYLGANSGNNLDQNIGNKITQEGTGLQNDLSQSKNTFQQGIDQQGQKLKDQQSDIDSTLADPTKVNDDTVQRFGQYRAGTNYTGPQGLGNVDSLTKQATDLQDFRNLARTSNPTGLLQRYLGGQGQYGQGQANFDRMLLGNGENIRRGLSVLNQASPNAINTAQTNAQQQAQGVQKQQLDAAKALRDRLGVTDTSGLTGGGMIQDVYNQAAQQPAVVQKQYQAALQHAQQLVAQNGGDVSKAIQQLTPAEQQMTMFQQFDRRTGQNKPATLASVLGQTQSNRGIGGGSGLFGVNPLSYLGQISDVNSTASPDQIARMQALAKLSGADTTSLLDPSKAHPITPFDQTGFQGAITQNQNSYNNAFQNLHDQMNQYIKAYNNGYGGISPQDYNNQLTALSQQAKALEGQYGLSPSGLGYSITDSSGTRKY